MMQVNLTVYSRCSTNNPGVSTATGQLAREHNRSVLNLDRKQNCVKSHTLPSSRAATACIRSLWPNIDTLRRFTQLNIAHIGTDRQHRAPVHTAMQRWKCVVKIGQKRLINY